MPRKYTTKFARLLKRTGKHLRIDLGTEAELRQLGRSYIDLPIYPIIVNPDGEIADGNRRHAGVMLENPDAEVPVCETDEALTPSALLEIQMESAAHTKGLSDYEQAIGAIEWLKFNPGATAKELSARVHQNESILSKKLSLRKCIPPVQDAARLGLIPYTKWPQFAALEEEAQRALLARCLKNGKPPGGPENGDGKTEKVSAIRLPLGDGFTWSMKGPGLSLDAAIEKEEEALSLLKAARADGHSAKTIGEWLKNKRTAKANQPPTKARKAKANGQAD